jgi:hypothetical protein
MIYDGLVIWNIIKIQIFINFKNLIFFFESSDFKLL